MRLNMKTHKNTLSKTRLIGVNAGVNEDIPIFKSHSKYNVISD
jgi:hypothetical protein